MHSTGVLYFVHFVRLENCQHQNKIYIFNFQFGCCYTIIHKYKGIFKYNVPSLHNHHSSNLAFWQK